MADKEKDFFYKGGFAIKNWQGVPPNIWKKIWWEEHGT